jgi:DNA-binding NarL/FixJ family response regulator
VAAQGRAVTTPPPSGLRVLIADDHRIFAEVLAAGLVLEGRFSTVDVACSPSHARLLLNVYRYDLLLLDPSLDLDSWLTLLGAVVEERPSLVVVVVSRLEDVEEVIRVLELGVRAWVSKGMPLDGLLHAIDEAMSGVTSLPPALLRPVLEELLGRPPLSVSEPSFLDELTPRQREVLQCLGEGMSRTQIAEHLLLSPHTVRTHVQEVLRKAGVNSTLAALARAREVGFRGAAPPDRASARRDRED